MSEAKSESFPRRDAEGRIVALGDLLGTTLAGVVIGVLALVVFDFAFAMIGLGEFGRANGWLAVILPAWLFVEEFRAWGGRFEPPGKASRAGPSVGFPTRILVALLAAAVAVALGLLAAGLAAALPPLADGAIAAAAFALSYALIWFSGIRWLAHRMG